MSEHQSSLSVPKTLYYVKEIPMILLEKRGMQKSCSSDCICDRSSGVVMCHLCLHTFKGRIRLQCPEHKNSFWLMDMEVCPNIKCQAGLEDLQEFCEPETKPSRHSQLSAGKEKEIRLWEDVRGR